MGIENQKLTFEVEILQKRVAEMEMQNGKSSDAMEGKYP